MQWELERGDYCSVWAKTPRPAFTPWSDLREPSGCNDKVMRNPDARAKNARGRLQIFLLHSPIQTSILNRLRDVGWLDVFRSFQVGDGAADFEDAAVGAGA